MTWAQWGATGLVFLGVLGLVWLGAVVWLACDRRLAGRAARAAALGRPVRVPVEVGGRRDIVRYGCAWRSGNLVTVTARSFHLACDVSDPGTSALITDDRRDRSGSVMSEFVDAQGRPLSIDTREAWRDAWLRVCSTPPSDRPGPLRRASLARPFSFGWALVPLLPLAVFLGVWFAGTTTDAAVLDVVRDGEGSTTCAVMWPGDADDRSAEVGCDGTEQVRDTLQVRTLAWPLRGNAMAMSSLPVGLSLGLGSVPLVLVVALAVGWWRSSRPATPVRPVAPGAAGLEDELDPLQ